MSEPGSEDTTAGTLAVADASKARHEPLPKAFWPALVLGWGAIAVGLLGVLEKTHHFAGTAPWKEIAKWTIGLAVIHDLLIAPAVSIIGLAIVRILPRRVRGPIQAGLIVSALVTITAWPVYRVGVPLRGNSSILPGDYGRGLLVVLSVIWFVTLAIVARTLLRRPLTQAGTDPD